MAGGEVCYKLFTRVIEQQSIATPTDIPSYSGFECCFTLPALADLAGTDIYRNDKHSILGKYDKSFYGLVTIYIQKLESGAWVDQVAVVDNSYGAFSGYGTYNDSAERLNYVGLFADWQLILNAFGEGDYRFRFSEVDFQMNTTETIYPFQFCLNTYNEARADKTTRFSWNTQGYRGDGNIDSDIWDYTNIVGGWDNQLRLPDSFFGHNKSEYEREFVKYSNGNQVWTQDEQVENYRWQSGHYPAILHNFIKTNILQADTLKVTDYNSLNPNVIKDKEINANSSYEPNWRGGILNAFVSLDFVQAIQNRIKKRC